MPMNHVGNMIIDVLASQSPTTNLGYLDEKKEQLERHTSPQQSLAWVARLDNHYRKLIAQKLGVSLNDLNTTLEVLNKI